MVDWRDLEERLQDLERSTTAARPLPLDEKTIWDDDVHLVEYRQDEWPEIIVRWNGGLYYVEDWATAWTSYIENESSARVMGWEDDPTVKDTNPDDTLALTT